MSKSIQKYNDSLGMSVLDGISIASSRQVAENFEKRHDHVIRDVEVILEGLPKSGDTPQMFYRTTYIHPQNKQEYPEYLMNRDGFTLLAMGFTGSKALKWKLKYIQAFNDMEDFIKNRYVAKLEYPELSSMIRLQHANPQHYHFSNEADLINKIVLGATSKQFRHHHRIPKKEAIRDYMQPWQIEAIQKLQKVDVGLVVAVKEFKERKKILQTYFDTLYSAVQLPIA